MTAAVPGWKGRRRQGGGGSENSRDPLPTTIGRSPQANRFRELVRHLHRLGPRPVGELLLEISYEHGIAVEIEANLEQFAALDPTVVAALGGRDWLSSPPLRVVWP